MIHNNYKVQAVLILIITLGLSSQALGQKMENGAWKGFMISPGMAELPFTFTISEDGHAGEISWVAGNFTASEIEIGHDWYKFVWSPSFEVECLIEPTGSGIYQGACRDGSGGKGPFIIGRPGITPTADDLNFAEAATIWQRMAHKSLRSQIPQITSSKQTTVNGTRYNYVEEGNGEVTVIFLNGEADELRVWSEVYGPVSSFAKVFLYDRAGNGQSEAAQADKSAEQVSTELFALLESTGQAGPYILVGHAGGALYARTFAGLNIGEIDGLLLINPTHELTGTELSKINANSWAEFIRNQDNLINIAPESAGKELAFVKDILESQKFDDQIRDGQIQGTVLSYFAKRDEARWIGESKEGQLAIQALHKDLADRFLNGKLIVNQGGNGYIHRENPEMVISALRAMVKNKN